MGLLVSPAASAQGMKGDYHEDARFGFKIKPPKGWKGIPVPSGQSWVIGKYLSEKSYFYTEKGSYTYEFQPEMVIVAFVSDDLKKAARKQASEEAKDKEDKDAEEDRERALELALESDFRDFKDYLTKTYSGGGFYFSKEEAGESDGMRTSLYEAKVEKGSSGGPKRIVARVYSLPDVDIAVEIEILDQDYDKLSSIIEGTFNSFKAIPRAGSMPVMQGLYGGGDSSLAFEDLDQATPEQRGEKRRQQQQAAHERAIAGLAEGWHHTKLDGFLIVSRAEDRFDKKVAEQAGAVMAWLDKTFPYIGQGEYVREPIIRICKDAVEQASFDEEQGLNLFELGLEVTTNQEYGGTRSFEFGLINARMAVLWFNDRDRRLLRAMPDWLSHGLIHMTIDATAKGSKLEFYRGEWTADVLRQVVSENRLLPPRDLIYMTSDEFSAETGGQPLERDKQAQALVDYLLLGPGSKSPKTKDLIRSYITNLQAVIAEMAQDLEAEKKEHADADKPKTEEEEEAALKEERELWKARERQLINEVGRRTFSGWDEKDWNDLAKGYSKEL